MKTVNVNTEHLCCLVFDWWRFVYYKTKYVPGYIQSILMSISDKIDKKFNFETGIWEDKTQVSIPTESNPMNHLDDGHWSSNRFKE